MDPTPSRPGTPAPKRGNFTIVLALLACLVVTAFLLVLPLLGYIGLAILIGGSIFFGIIGLHYLVWGRWLSQIVQQEQSEEKD